MKLNWRAWQALATRDAVDGAKAKGVKPKLIKPNKDGPHSAN